MNEHMNPDYPKQRGCFISEDKNAGKFSVVDYPTWSFNDGRWIPGTNEPIRNGNDFKRDFNSYDDALNFCRNDQYVVCAHPKSKEELASIAAKREAHYAERDNDRDQYDEVVDI